MFSYCVPITVSTGSTETKLGWLWSPVPGGGIEGPWRPMYTLLDASTSQLVLYENEAGHASKTPLQSFSLATCSLTVMGELVADEYAVHAFRVWRSKKEGYGVSVGGSYENSCGGDADARECVVLASEDPTTASEWVSCIHSSAIAAASMTQVWIRTKRARPKTRRPPRVDRQSLRKLRLPTRRATHKPNALTGIHSQTIHHSQSFPIPYVFWGMLTKYCTIYGYTTLSLVILVFIATAVDVEGICEIGSQFHFIL